MFLWTDLVQKVRFTVSMVSCYSLQLCGFFPPFLKISFKIVANSPVLLECSWKVSDWSLCPLETIFWIIQSFMTLNIFRRTKQQQRCFATGRKGLWWVYRALLLPTNAYERAASALPRWGQEHLLKMILRGHQLPILHLYTVIPFGAQVPVNVSLWI